MKKGIKDSEYRRIKVESDYSGFDFFLLKKPLQCCVRIPETILLDKNGAPRDWIFNSNKFPSHPILKKRKENLLPFTIIRNFCSKHVPATQLSGIKTIQELKQTVRGIILNKKDAEYASKRKHIEIRTVDNEILQINLLQFLQYIGENKFADQNFYDKWRMIQQRVSNSKLDESYIVESIRKNHLIQSKSSKLIAIGIGNKVVIDADSNDAFKQAAPSKELEVTQTKMVEGYKFFDTYLNKKFFTAVGEIIDCIEKNYKCIVESMTTRFVIDHNREPHLAAIQQIYLKPSSKLFEMRQFSQLIVSGQMKLDNYYRCLMQYIIENPARPEPNLEQPVYSQRGKRCKGEFCDVHTEIPHIAEPRMRLPMLPGFNTRKMNAALIESVKKRRGRIVEKLKENGVIDANYYFDNNESSQYEESDNESQVNVRVCENCFIFYVNVLKYFEVDGFGNLVQKRASAMRSRTLQNSQREVNKSYDYIKNNEGNINKKDQYNSLKTLQNRMKVIEDEKPTITPPIVRRSLSQHTKLRPIVQKAAQKGSQDQNQDKFKAQKPKKTLSKEPKDKNKINQIKSNKLIDAKLKNIVSVDPISKPSSISKAISLKKHTKPTNFYQASEQLVEKLEVLSNTNQQQFIFLAKKYYKDNLPQFVDRVWHSSQYLTHLYEFMSNSPIGIASGNRIKKRPEMSLKRLSQLTSYPQIVSRSAFIFDTIICDQKSTIPFCVISSKMIHNRNQPGKTYQNVIIVNDIFESYIESISMIKQILQEVVNTRFILFNYHGQSHTIYDKQLDFKPSDFSALMDKLLYRLSSQPNQLNIVQEGESYKLIGMGYGGYLVQSYMSLCPEVHSMINGVMLVNSSPYCTKKSREIYTSLLQLYSLEDPVTEQNAFLFYNKAINSIEIEKQDLENKSGLNSIKVDGRAFLLKNSLNFWNDNVLSNFEEYNGTVMLLYSRGDILLEKGDMQRIMFKTDLERTQLKGRNLKEIDGGHDIAAQNYDDLIKNIFLFIQ